MLSPRLANVRLHPFVLFVYLLPALTHIIDLLRSLRSHNPHSRFDSQTLSLKRLTFKFRCYWLAFNSHYVYLNFLINLFLCICGSLSDDLSAFRGIQD